MQEVLGAVAIIVPAILLLLVLSTLSWIEPVLFIAAIGVSIVLNMGTNIVLGEVSFIAYSVSPILQLAVSLDYAIFLLHAFAAERQRTADVEQAMACAMRRSLSTIAASATTTLFGFAALAFMQFQIGADLGINLVKGIAFSFVTVMVFLPALTLLVYRAIDKTAHRPLMPSFKNVDKALSKVRVPALVLVLALVVPAFLGQAHTVFTYQNNSPDPNLRSGADTLMVQDEFGHQNPLVVLVPQRRRRPQRPALAARSGAGPDNVTRRPLVSPPPWARPYRHRVPGRPPSPSSSTRSTTRASSPTPDTDVGGRRRPSPPSGAGAAPRRHDLYRGCGPTSAGHGREASTT